MSISHCNGYIFKISSLVVVQEFEVGKSSSEVQENLRNRLRSLTEVQVTDYAF